ncbi:MAG: nucleotide-binding protein [Oscillospiraceae bacterium]|nr:nucleotide-binding protein [Oscillospiraceae bacterium]
MFYHVVIEKTGESETKLIILTDITDKEGIINEILVPYLNNDEFMVNGYLLSKQNIERLLIRASDESAKKAADILNAKESKFRKAKGSAVNYTPELALSNFNFHTDETISFIKEALQEIDRSKYDIRKSGVDMNNKKVFIVHGHDNGAKVDVARFIERLGLEAVILHEQVSRGNTIIEKIEQNSNVGFCIVLYTPCDIGYEAEHEENKRSRARQNVVFEHGYMIAKLGRDNVCALVKGDVEKPKDISGVVYIQMDTNDGWKIQVAKELRSSGFSVDLNLIV